MLKWQIINMNYISEEDDSLFIFNANKMSACLQIRFQPFQILQSSKPIVKDTENSFSVLLGVRNIEDVPFLMIAADTVTCCAFQGSNIMEIKSIAFLPLVAKEKRLESVKKAESKIEDYEKLFAEGHYYYSDTYQLHQPFLMNIKPDSKHLKFYEQFVFNSTAMNAVDSPLLTKWCQPIIQGYIDSYSTHLPNHQRVNYLLISRRSCKKAGTRYYSRGIDDKGNVANFTETEQIIEFKEFCISHLQIRGSVPAFFEQLGISGLSGELNIVRNQATTQQAFQTHFNKLHDVYGHSFCVNLLSMKKSEEKKLTVFYESLINKYAPTYVRYQFFDFHEECKNNKFENADILVRQIREVIDCFDCNIVNTATRQIIRQQTGVMRTNCLDCLDRTNYVQSRIALHIFQKVIKNFSSPELRERLIQEHVFENRHELSSELLRNYNSIWAENGDSISLHYTGTGSTHTDITKNGKRTFKGTVHHKAKSLMRFFVQFTDTKKHQAINDLVADPLTSSVAFTQPQNFEFVNAVLMSFKIPKDSELQEHHNYLFTQEYVVRKRPGIVVIFGFLEPQFGVLDFLKINKKDNKDVNYFAEEKTYSIRRLGYELISQVKNQGSCLLIFGNEAVVPNLSEIKSESLGKGKDTLLISKFNIFHSSMVFSGMNCSKFDNFVEVLEKSHDEAFQINRLGQAKSSSILTHNYRTVLGDIASGSNLGRIELDDIRAQIQYMRSQRDQKNEIKVINKVLDNDQLSQLDGQEYRYMKNYMEGPTHFVPERNRIIFWNKEGLIVKVLEYREHTGQRCVYGHFSYELKKAN